MLAHSVRLKVIAEGTETENQIAELKRLNCEMAQGFIFSARGWGTGFWPVIAQPKTSGICHGVNLQKGTSGSKKLIETGIEPRI